MLTSPENGYCYADSVVQDEWPTMALLGEQLLLDGGAVFSPQHLRVAPQLAQVRGFGGCHLFRGRELFHTAIIVNAR